VNTKKVNRVVEFVVEGPQPSFMRAVTVIGCEPDFSFTVSPILKRGAAGR
jgi:hypothetical protein